MIRKLPCATLIELVEEVGVDQPARSMVRPVRPLEASHTLYKGAGAQKVARGAEIVVRAPPAGAAGRFARGVRLRRVVSRRGESWPRVGADAGRRGVPAGRLFVGLRSSSSVVLVRCSSLFVVVGRRRSSTPSVVVVGRRRDFAVDFVGRRGDFAVDFAVAVQPRTAIPC